jgi:hypothetical protein
MPTTKNIYRGMNQDMSKTTHTPEFYYEGRNIRTITEDGLSTSAIENDKGNILVAFIPRVLATTVTSAPTGATYPPGTITITDVNSTVFSNITAFVEPTGLTNDEFLAAYVDFLKNDPGFNALGIDAFLATDKALVYGGLLDIDAMTVIAPVSISALDSKVIGEGKIREDIYFFSAEQDTYNESNYGFIWKFNYSQDNNDDFLPSSLYLSYGEILGFSGEFPIGDEVEGRYESPEIQKLYWADGKNQLRFINAVNDNSYLNPDILNVLPENITSPISIDIVTSGGSIKSGIIQYAYQLVSPQGGGTSISPLSNPIHIAESNQSDNTTDYFGAPVGYESGKAISLSLSDIDSKFEYVKLYRIHYTDEFNVPKIDLIAEELSKNGSIRFTDNGLQTLGALSNSQFTGLIGTYFIPETLATKDNRLFTANHQEESYDFDFDARAYRFDNGGLGYPINGISGPVVNPAIPEQWEGIDETADVYNQGNLAVNETTYAFKSDGVTYGGEGPNVSYTFITEDVIIDQDSNSFQPLEAEGQRKIEVSNANINQYSNAAEAIANAGYKRGETYRFAMKAVSKRGQSSFVKWIGDIRFPTTADGYPSTTILANGDIIALKIFPRFEIDLSSLSQEKREDIDYIEIVRVERTELDKTILGQGVINPIMLYQESGGLTERRVSPYVMQVHEIGLPGHLDAMSEADYNFFQGPLEMSTVEFISPEQIFRKKISHDNGDFIRYETISNRVTRNAGTPDDLDNGAGQSQAEPYLDISGEPTPLSVVNSLTTDNNRWVVTKSRASETRVNNIPGNVQVEISDAISVDGTKGLINNVDGIQVHNKISFSPDSLIAGTNTGGKEARGNSKMYLKLEAPVTDLNWIDFTPQTGKLDTGIIIADYKRPVTAQYGGFNYGARSNNKYITTHSRIKLTNTTVTIDAKGGDTYITYFDYLRLSIIDDQNSIIRKWQEVVMVPLETTINLELRHDRSWNYLAAKSGKQTYPQLQESLAFSKQQPSYVNDNDIQEYSDKNIDLEQTDLYLFNETYARPDNLFYSFPIPQISNFSEEFDVQHRFSFPKIDNEVQDSWTIFITDNQGAVDSKYGPVTKLISFKDEIFCIQPEGYGQWSINPRVQTTASDGEPLELGTGGILHDFNYISTKFGTNQKFGIISSQLNMYFIDSKTYKLVKIGQGTGNISDMLGVSSSLRNLIINDLKNLSNPILGNGITAVHDRRFNDIIFTIKQSNGEDDTIVFNELTNSFVEWADYKPVLYSEHSKNLFSFDDQDSSTGYRKNIYAHHYGPRGVYYGQDPKESYVSVLVNPNPDFTKRFDNIEFYSQIFDVLGNELFEETITAVRFYNDYQDSGKITLTNRQNIRKRMRKWRMDVKRDQVDNKSRMRNPYLFITLYFDNNNDKRLVLHHLATYYNVKPY